MANETGLRSLDKMAADPNVDRVYKDADGVHILFKDAKRIDAPGVQLAWAAYRAGRTLTVPPPAVRRKLREETLATGLEAVAEERARRAQAEDARRAAEEQARRAEESVVCRRCGKPKGEHHGWGEKPSCPLSKAVKPGSRFQS